MSKMIVLVAVLMGLWCGGAQACLPGMWLPGFFGKVDAVATSMQYSYKSATALWDPDGAGPKGEIIVFIGFDNTNWCSNLLGWDGANIKTFATAIIGTTGYQISAIAVYNGDIIAAVLDPNRAGGLARWNAIAMMWELLPGTSDIDDIIAFKVFNGQLYVLNFRSTGIRLFAWNGSSLVEQIFPSSTAPNATSLEVINDQLYVTGYFSVGYSYAPLYNYTTNTYYNGPDEPGIAYEGRAVIWYNNELILGTTNLSSCVGTTSCVLSCNGDYEPDTVYAIWKWTGGGWEPKGDTCSWAGLNFEPGTSGCVDFAIYRNQQTGVDELYASRMPPSNPLPGGPVVKLNNATAEWQDVSSPPSAAECPLRVYNNQLLAITCDGVIGNLDYAPGVASWDNQRWKALGQGVSGSPGGPIQAMAVDTTTNKLYVGGGFTDAGKEAVNCVGRWNGDYWEPVGNLSHACSALIMWDRDGGGPEAPSLVAGGSFIQADGVTVNGIARWNGTSWSAVGNGFNIEVKSLCVYDGQLVAGGSFTKLGDNTTPMNRIARWNGTSWVAVGNGFDSEVKSLCVYAGQLVAGGSFGYSGSTPVNRIARWNGTAWVAMGSGFNDDSSVKALCVYKGQLYAGGSFTASGSTSVKGIARWSGSAWQPLINGIPGTNSSVNTLTVFDGELIVGGQFEGYVGYPGDQPAKVRNVARWSGSWQGMGYGITGRSWDNTYQAAAANVYALTTYHDPKSNRDELYIGGDFDMADNPDPNTSKPSLNIAHWIKRP